MRTGRPAKPIVTNGQFERLTVMRQVENDKHGRAQYECKCLCGNLTIARATDLRTGHKKSCGCMARSGLSNLKHGHGRASGPSRAYQCWKNMKGRCNGDPESDRYKDYAGRGITYDPRWEEFENFLADMGEPPKGTSLDRIDNDGNYTRKNCRWADRLTQRVNQRPSGGNSIRWVTIDGERMNLKDAVKKYSSVGYISVLGRVDRGWDIMDAILKPQSEHWPRRGNGIR